MRKTVFLLMAVAALLFDMSAASGTAAAAGKISEKKITFFAATKTKNKSDISALKKLIRKQRKAGAKIPEAIDAPCYKWNAKGRLYDIDLSGKKLKGKISFSEFSCLEKLEVYMNKLTELDISGNAKLNYVDCEYNQLTELDVERNTRLKFLYCGNNQLSGKLGRPA